MYIPRCPGCLSSFKFSTEKNCFHVQNMFFCLISAFWVVLHFSLSLWCSYLVRCYKRNWWQNCKKCCFSASHVNSYYQTYSFLAEIHQNDYNCKSGKKSVKKAVKSYFKTCSKIMAQWSIEKGCYFFTFRNKF
jgi:hypothetical protein